MAGSLSVEVIYALPDRSWRVPLSLATGATVADAIAQAGMTSKVPGLVVDPARLAVFGRAATLDTVLHDGDRVEILRPLIADAKQARRERARGAAKP